MLQWRVLRGGSWYYLLASARCSFRYWYPPDFWDYAFGVRVSIRLVRSNR